jgi:hypothetical protein
MKINGDKYQVGMIFTKIVPKNTNGTK